jgi:type II secretory pathway predicted ATPase ExeA
MTKMTDKPVDLRSHFGFTSTPFTREIPITERWCAPLFDEPLDDLRRTIEQRMSAVLLAPSGTGKTLLLRALREQLPEARYRVQYVKVTSLSKRELYREIALAAGIEPAGSYPTLMRRLQEHFRNEDQDDGRRPVLILDEGQDLRAEVLATLRLLTNYDMDSRLVLSVVLAGDAGLRQLLERQELAPVSRRLAHCAALRLLSRAETRQYLEHRLRIAGARTVPFDEGAVDAVFEISRGNLRAINRLCRKALERAALADLPAVDPSLVTAARQQLLL